VKLKRRQLLQALGLGALVPYLSEGRVALAGPTTFPSRILFYVQPHGHLPLAWNMAIPGGPTDQFAARPLHDLAQTDFSPTLQPLYQYRDKLLVIEGLCHTSVLWDIAQVMAAGSGDLNNHQVAVAGTLTGSRALQQPGTYCTGGATTLDQVIGSRFAAPGRFDSRVYGFNYIPNSVISPFSYLGAGEATPMVSDPGTAFQDLLGYLTPTSGGGLQSMRPSVLDAVANEYDLLAPQLGSEGRQKLDQHRDLVRQLEQSLGVTSSAQCTTTLDTTVVDVRQFMQLARMAFACDLTRVIMFNAPVPLTTDLGYPGSATFHMYAHESIDGGTACGQPYSPLAQQAITDLDAWHAGHVAYLLEQLDSVPEGSGTMLDNTVVVWIPELGTPTHLHYDLLLLLAGGCNGFFKTGQYVRYPRNLANPLAGMPMTGPGHNRLHVSLLQAMGQSDTSFGLTEVTGSDGSTIPLTGALTEIQSPRLLRPASGAPHLP
jgi:hypothetical protein